MTSETEALILLGQAIAHAGHVLARHVAVMRAKIVDKPSKYPTVRAAFYEDVYAAFNGYLEGGGSVTRYRNQLRDAVETHFPAGFYRGYLDAGGEETEKEDETWLNGEIDRQIDFVYAAFESLKAMREAGDVDAGAEAEARAVAWAGTLDGVYAEGKFRGDGNKMLTFLLRKDAPAAEDPCTDCARYEGQRHSAKWWIARGLVARNGNENFECGRWADHCFHEFYTDEGVLWTF